MRVLLLWCLVFLSVNVIGQELLPLQLPVNINGAFKAASFSGGVHSAQFSAMDVDNDGLEDVVIFDKMGDVWSVYKRFGNGANDLSYDYSLSQLFPAVNHWALLRDYNCDGVEDIFTYSQQPGIAGMAVYKGAMSTDNELSFELVTPVLYELDLFDFESNLYVSSIDIPAIEDTDGDGDLDILTFDFSGTYLSLYTNESQENGHGCDSLTFQLADNCWGRVYEDGFNENILLSPSIDSCLF